MSNINHIAILQKIPNNVINMYKKLNVEINYVYVFKYLLQFLEFSAKTFTHVHIVNLNIYYASNTDSNPSPTFLNLNCRIRTHAKQNIYNF